MVESNIWNMIRAYYISSPIWLVLTVVSLVYIVARSDKETRKKMLLITLFFVLVILNEFSYHVLTKIFDTASYYRFLWVIPYGMIVAYAFMRILLDMQNVVFVRKNESVNKFVRMAVGAILCIAVVGVLYFTQGNYIRNLRDSFPQNKFLVDDDVLEVKGLLDQERSIGNAEEIPTIACDKSLMLQYQTVDPGSIVSTNRVVYLQIRDYGADISELPQVFKDKYLLSTICEDNAQPDVMQVKAALIREQIDYFIVHANAGMEGYLESLDCTPVGNTTSYLVYRVNNHYYDAVSDSGEIDGIIEHIGLNVRDITISFIGNSAGDVTETADEVTDKGKPLATYLLLNDLHMLLTTDDTSEEFWQTIQERYANWALTSTGMHSADTWQNLSAILDSYHADGILMAGDMVDFASSTNYDLFQRGLSKISTPILYARADHDTSAWYNSDGTYTNDDAAEAHNRLYAGNITDDNSTGSLTPQADIMVWDKGEYYIIAWNNSTSQLTEEGLEVAKNVFATGKPILLVTHVPINSTIDDGLYNASKEFDDRNRAKLWGENCLYVPNDVTREFIDMVVEENSPVRAVLCGHLHFRYETKLNSRLTEYVFDPTFAGNMVRVTIEE